MLSIALPDVVKLQSFSSFDTFNLFDRRNGQILANFHSQRVIDLDMSRNR